MVSTSRDEVVATLKNAGANISYVAWKLAK